MIEGHIEKLDLDNLVTNTEGDITLYDSKNFHNNLIVNGCVYFKGLVKGINLTELCIHSNISNPSMELIVNGN